MAERYQRVLRTLGFTLGILCGSLSLAQAASPLASHRAVYSLTLAHAESKSPVSSARGQLVIEWLDTCEGYTTNQRLYTEFGDNEGGSMVSDLWVSSWESTDGNQFRFNLTSQVNGAVDERARGSATRESPTGAGEVKFDAPRAERLALPKGTIFPTEHTQLLIAAAHRGSRTLERTLFDGSASSGLSTVSAFIGPQISAPARPAPASARIDKALLAGPTWPVRLAFYREQSAEGLPDYEFAFHLHENGVASDLVLDYGDFAVKGTLDTLEGLAGCSQRPSP